MRVTGAVTALGTLVGCAASSVEVPPTPVIPGEYDVDALEMKVFDLSEVNDWEKELNLNPWEKELVLVSLHDNKIDSKVSYAINYNGQIYAYEFYYSSENSFNHFVPSLEEFRQIYQLVLDIYKVYVGDGEFARVRSTKVFLGKEWKHLNRGGKTFYVSEDNVAYSFAGETSGTVPLDVQMMEFVHTLTADIGQTSYHLGREGFAASVAVAAWSGRNGYQYDSGDEDPAISTRNYTARAEWARTMGLTIPDTNDHSREVPIRITVFPKHIYDRFLDIFRHHPYVRGQNVNNESQSLILDSSLQVLYSFANKGMIRGKVPYGKRDVRMLPVLLIEYLAQFPRSSQEELIKYGEDWLRYGATI